MKMNGLQEKLKNLNVGEIRRSALAGEVPQEFRKIAEAVFNGHFLVSSAAGSVKIYPTCIELYWHEERDDIDIKDYMVYHRNKKAKPEVFPLGVLHNHVSGIDITFEQGDNPESAVRASVLVREYRVVENGTTVIEETRPTRLYDYLYGRFPVFDGGFGIVWEDDEDAGGIIDDCRPRHNVAKYKGKEREEIKAGSITTANGKHVQDERRWQFRLRRS